MEASKIKAGGIIRNERLARISVLSAPDRPGLASAVLRALGSNGINVQFIVQCIDSTRHSHVILAVSHEDLDIALAALDPVKTQVGAESVDSQRDMALVSVFGPDFRERPAIAAGVFDAMASAGINIMAISTSISTVSCLIDGAHTDDALLALQRYFELP